MTELQLVFKINLKNRWIGGVRVRNMKYPTIQAGDTQVYERDGFWGKETGSSLNLIYLKLPSVEFLISFPS